MIRKSSTLLTDGYRGIGANGFIHDPIKSRDDKAACEQLTLCGLARHRTTESLRKR